MGSNLRILESPQRRQLKLPDGRTMNVVSYLYYIINSYYLEREKENVYKIWDA